MTIPHLSALTRSIWEQVTNRRWRLFKKRTLFWIEGQVRYKKMANLLLECGLKHAQTLGPCHVTSSCSDSSNSRTQRPSSCSSVLSFLHVHSCSHQALRLPLLPTCLCLKKPYRARFLLPTMMTYDKAILCLKRNIGLRNRLL